MGYSIDISENGKYLRVVVNVDVTVELASEWTSELVELTRLNGIKKYLTDVRKVRNVSNATDNYSFSYNTVSKLKLDRASRSAVIADPDDRSHDFIETTMINAGYDLRLFYDESEAIEWLQE